MVFEDREFDNFADDIGGVEGKVKNIKLIH